MSSGTLRTPTAFNHHGNLQPDPELLYALRKLGVAIGALESPPRLATQQPASDKERLRLLLEQPVDPFTARVPTDEELQALSARLAHDHEHASPLGRARNLADGWLLFSYGGLSDVLLDALEVFSAFTVARALRSRDPLPNNFSERAAALDELATRRASEAASMRGVLDIIGPRHPTARGLEREYGSRSASAHHAELVSSKLAELASPCRDVYARTDELRQAEKNWIAARRDRYWGRVADVLAYDHHWTDEKLAALVMTGAGAPDGYLVPTRDWAFPLCPLDARRGEKLIDSIGKERRRRNR